MSEIKCKIGTFAKIRRGASPRPIGDPKYFGGEVGWIRISDVTASTKYLRKTEQYVSSLGESLSVRVDKGDLVMSICGTIGRPIIIDFPSCIHDGFVQLYDIKDADTEYLYYILQFHEKDLENKGQPGTQVNLNTSIVENFEIFLPILPEQRRIARILSTTDAVIEKTQAAIAKYKAIKQGMLQDLFTRGIDSATNKLRPRYEDAPELYKESKLGWIPREWEVERIEELVNIDSEQLNTSTDSDFTFFYIDISSIATEQIIYPIHPIRLQGAPSRARRIIKYNDILMSTVRPNLKAFAHFKRQSNYQFIASTGFAVLSPKIRIDIDFVFQVLFTEYFERQIEKYVVGSNYPAINSTDLKILLVKTPKKLEQTEIAKRVLTIGNKLRSEQAYLQKLQQLKRGLMEDLLSGKKRVDVAVANKVPSELISDYTEEDASKAGKT